MRRLGILPLLALAACGGGDRVVVGSKNFTEQRLLGELLAQTIEAAGMRVDRRFDLGGTFVCHTALRAGQIDVYVEYTGTALTAILKDAPLADPAAALGRVRAAYTADGLVWTTPLGFDNTFALVIRGDDATRKNVHTISDAARHADTWRAGFGYEFAERADGYPGLARTYNLAFAEVRTMDLGLLYRALVDRQVDVVAGNATDGMIEKLELVVLTDDRHYFPPYEAAPVVRASALGRHAGLREALESLGGKVSAEAMRRMNYAVDGERRGAAEVVREWRRERASVGAAPPTPSAASSTH